MNRLGAVILAAGASARFECGHKLHQQIAGHAVLDWTLAGIAAAPVVAPIVVAAPGDTAAHALAAAHGMQVVVNPRPELGMGSSIACGMAALPTGLAGVFVCLGDMPFISADTYRRLADAYRAAPARDIVAPSHAGIRGQPVLFGARHFPALLALSGDRGARDLIARAGEALMLVATTDRGVVTDIDTVQDLDNARGLLACLRSAVPGE